MFFRMQRLLPVIVFLLLMVSCNEYQKVLKNEDIKAKYDLAEKYYKEGDFKRALRLFEQVAPKYVGKPQGERVMFFLADSYYKQGDYTTATYQLERFVKSYPKSEKLVEASFLGAKSTYNLSPVYSLEQSDTDKALSKLQTFINTYSESEYFAEANIMALELTQKKERKAYEIAKQFNKLGKFDYTFLTPAIAAFTNFLSDYPGSIYREEAMFYRFQSATELALNSLVRLKSERFKNARKYYATFIKQFPETEFEPEAQRLLDRINREEELTVGSTTTTK